MNTGMRREEFGRELRLGVWSSRAYWAVALWLQRRQRKMLDGGGESGDTPFGLPLQVCTSVYRSESGETVVRFSRGWAEVIADKFSDEQLRAQLGDEMMKLIGDTGIIGEEALAPTRKPVAFMKKQLISDPVIDKDGFLLSPCSMPWLEGEEFSAVSSGADVKTVGEALAGKLSWSEMSEEEKAEVDAVIGSPLDPLAEETHSAKARSFQEAYELCAAELKAADLWYAEEDFKLKERHKELTAEAREAFMSVAGELMQLAAGSAASEQEEFRA